MSGAAIETSFPVYETYALPPGATASLCFDMLRKEGLNPIAIGSPLDPIDRYEPFIGRAFTVRGEATDMGDHESLIEWTRMLSKTPGNCVLVIEPGDHARSYMGELSANALTLRKVAAAVVDGPCRDSNQMRKLGFPVFSHGTTPRDIVGTWQAVDYGAPVTIMGETVTCDDLIIGDSDGLCITHRDNYPLLAQRLLEGLNSENMVRDMILRGHDPLDAYMRYRKF